MPGRPYPPNGCQPTRIPVIRGSRTGCRLGVRRQRDGCETARGVVTSRGTTRSTPVRRS